jgi:hypothetical protein
MKRAIDVYHELRTEADLTPEVALNVLRIFFEIPEIVTPEGIESVRNQLYN